MDFVTGQDEPLCAIENLPKSDDKYVEKVLNCSEVHLSELTCYKIHSLVFHEKKNQGCRILSNKTWQKWILN